MSVWHRALLITCERRNHPESPNHRLSTSSPVTKSIGNTKNHGLKYLNGGFLKWNYPHLSSIYRWIFHCTPGIGGTSQPPIYRTPCNFRLEGLSLSPHVWFSTRPAGDSSNLPKSSPALVVMHIHPASRDLQANLPWPWHCHIDFLAVPVWCNALSLWQNPVTISVWPILDGPEHHFFRFVLRDSAKVHGLHSCPSSCVGMVAAVCSCWTLQPRFICPQRWMILEHLPSTRNYGSSVISSHSHPSHPIPSP